MLGLRRRLLFPGPRRRVTSPPPPGAEVWWLEDGDAKVEAWFVPGAGVTAQRPGPLVVFAHGNGEVIDQWPPSLVPYRSLGISVLLPEYRGYGRSRGVPSQPAITRDFAAALGRATARRDVDNERIVFHGRSLGGGVACSLAREHPPAAMILWSTFVDVPTAARRFGAPAWLVPDRFENHTVVAMLDIPMLLVHGRQDWIVPVNHAERLHAIARRSELLLYDAGHNDCPPTGCDAWSRTTDWLRRHGLIG